MTVQTVVIPVLENQSQWNEKVSKGCDLIDDLKALFNQGPKADRSQRKQRLSPMLAKQALLSIKLLEDALLVWEMHQEIPGQSAFQLREPANDDQRINAGARLEMACQTAQTVLSDCHRNIGH